jgi:hypothetical protein
LSIPHKYKRAVFSLVVNDDAVDLEMVSRDRWVVEHDLILVSVRVSAKPDGLVWKYPEICYPQNDQKNCCIKNRLSLATRDRAGTRKNKLMHAADSRYLF